MGFHANPNVLHYVLGVGWGRKGLRFNLFLLGMVQYGLKYLFVDCTFVDLTLIWYADCRPKRVNVYIGSFDDDIIDLTQNMMYVDWVTFNCSKNIKSIF